jgi:Putative prokaryotic signal transducing protein
MKKVFTASNSAEASMVQGCLAEAGIESSIQGEHTAVHFAQPVTVWIMNDTDEEKARLVSRSLS